MPRRLFRKAVQQGRSERRGESYSAPYVEPLSDARTQLAAFVNSLLCKREHHSESGKRHEIPKISIAGNKCCMVIQTALCDERIGEICSATSPEQFCSEEPGTLPKSFGNRESRKFENGSSYCR